MTTKTATKQTKLTTKQRIVSLLPDFEKEKEKVPNFQGVTLKQIMARLNRAKNYTPVPNSTVRGRLSELYLAGLVVRKAHSGGTKFCKI